LKLTEKNLRLKNLKKKLRKKFVFKFLNPAEGGDFLVGKIK